MAPQPAPERLNPSTLEPLMRAYVITTGIIFALLALAHVWRVIAEGPGTLNPWFVGITIVAGAIAGWAFRLVRASAPGV